MISIPRAALELTRFASKDAYRANLNVFHIEADGTRAIAVGTDGHRMGVVSWPCSHEVGSWNIPLEGARHLLKILKAQKADTVDLDPGMAMAYSCKDMHGTFLSAEVTFPDWRQVMPSGDVSGEPQAPGAVEVGFNPCYLADMGAYFKALKIEAIAQHVGAIDTRGPMLWTATLDDMDIKHIIMPHKLKGN